MVRWLVLTVAFVTPAADSALVYDLEWRVAASVSRLRNGDVDTRQGDMAGRGRLVLQPQGEGVLAFEWRGPDGSGSGIIGPGGPEHVTFPIPPDVGFPPAPPHRGAGTFEYEGERDRPSAFAVRWVEAFYCRTAPAACDNVTAWERSFAGVARRLHRDTRRRGSDS